MEDSSVIVSNSADNKEIRSKEYTYDQALKSSLTYFNGDELAASTWIKKYAVTSGPGNFLEKTPEDMHHRLAREFARIEQKYRQLPVKGDERDRSDYGIRRGVLTEKKIVGLLDHFKYVIPQGSVMAALGNDHMLASLSNCVVVPPPFDSYGGIMYTDQQLVQLFKRRCGVGFDISSLRPSGLAVSNAAGTTTGAISFMHRFSNTTREVAQNGRRGALMITLDIRHPEIQEFIKIKQDLSKVTGANISVRVTDEFMQAVTEDKEFELRWPVESDNPEITRKVKAKILWDELISAAHQSAEPGVIFWDKQHRYSTSSVYPEFKNSSTNPCSEIAMQGGDSCRLIALNMFNFVHDPFTPQAKFDLEKWYEITYEAQRLNDDLVDLELEAIDRILNKVENDPEPDHIKQIERETWKLLKENGEKGRRTGLGFTALADTLAALGLAFDSDEALGLVEEIMRTKCRAEFDCSIDMAIERGRFEAFDPDIENTSEFVQMLHYELPEVYERMMRNGRRNISLSTVAPTGTLSMMAQTSSGIEPVFMLSYTRRKKVNAADASAKVSFVDDSGDAWEEFEVHHPKLEKWMEQTGNQDMGESPYAGSTAEEIDWQKRVELQSVVQKYVTHSISSTINLPESIDVETVKGIYETAWKKGLKGITVYRANSRSGVLVETKPKQEQAAFQESVAPERPKILNARIIRFMNEKEEWLAFVGLIEGRPYEIFTGQAADAFNFPDYVKEGWIIKNQAEDGSSRYDFQFRDSQGYKVTIEGLSRSFNQVYWNYAKLISGILRHGMPLPDVVELVSKLTLDTDFINTWKNGVARALSTFIPSGTKSNRTCMNCGDQDGLVYEEGCLKCKSCGYTECG